MSCSRTRKIISLYVDGQLPEGAKRELEAHMEICESCRSEMEETKMLHQLFVKTEKFKAPAGFSTRVMANVNAAKRGWSPTVPIPVRLAEAAMALALIAAGLLSGSLFVKGLMPERAGSEMTVLHLELFQSAPPGTLGGAYLAMTGGRDEK